MEFEYYYIVIIVVVLKIMIWGCVIYFRSQKSRTVRAQRRFVVVDSRTGHQTTPSSFPVPPNATNDRSAIVNYEEPPATSQGPPSYSEVMANPQAAQDKPPSYSQVIEEQTGNPPDTRTTIPPHFTPPPEESRQ